MRFYAYKNYARDEPVDFIKKTLEKVLLYILPTANPDFQNDYKDVVEFWLEIDDKGEAIREIGFNKMNRPIVGGPIGENAGVFTDVSTHGESTLEESLLKNGKLQKLPHGASEFESMWQILNEQLAGKS